MGFQRGGASRNGGGVCGGPPAAWPSLARAVCLALALAASSADASAAAAESAGPGFRAVALPAHGEAFTALAREEDGGLVALGDEQGALLRGSVAASGGARPDLGEPAWRRIAGVGAVRDLCFTSAGRGQPGSQSTLWLGTDRGLWGVASQPGAAPRAAHLSLDSEAGGVHRLDCRGTDVLVASDAGAFLGTAAGGFRRLGAGLPLAPVEGVAWLPRDAELALLQGETLWRVRLEASAEGSIPGDRERLVVAQARRIRIPGRPTGQAPVDLVGSLPGADLLVVYPSAFARLLPSVPPQIGRWEVHHPVLPPGSTLRRVGASSGGAWLASDRGLLVAPALPGPFRILPPPLGHVGVWGVVPGAGASFPTALVLTQRALFTGVLPARAEGATGLEPAASAAASGDPLLGEVHRRVLAYTGLERSRLERWRRRLWRRGFWPTVSLRAGAAYGRDTASRRDQSFTYGALHDLHDRDLDVARDFDADVTLSWDLGEAVYPDDVPDLSRETRQLIALRDSVLDEVTQLYFDRQRTLHALAAFLDRSDPEAVALAWRAEELAAGLDAWTGGWFSRATEAERRDSSPPTPRVGSRRPTVPHSPPGARAARWTR